MMIKSVRIQRFRGILDETFHFGRLAALVGANGCGKSSVFRSLELFFEPSANPTMGEEDFFASNLDHPIEITVTFDSLSADALERFEPFLEGAELTVTRVIEYRDGKLHSRFHGSRLQNPEFRDIRSESNASGVLDKYRSLQKENPKYSTLPRVQSAQQARDAMAQWESENPSKLVRLRDDGQFFGLHNVNTGYLGDFIQFLLIPAVHDASESALDGRNSPINQLVNIAVRNTLSTLEDFEALKQHARQGYQSILDEHASPKLQELRSQLTETLRTFVPNSAVRLNWVSDGGIDIRMPQVQVVLREHGFEGPIGNMGHGLQRAFVISVLQHLTHDPSNDGSGNDDDVAQDNPSLVLAIEETELFQHPNRQRHFARVLRELSLGSIRGVADKTQVLYSTHSPLFVGIDRVPEIILLRKQRVSGDAVGYTTATQVTGDDIAHELWRTVDPSGEREPFTWQTLRPRMTAVMNAYVNEAFFAEMVVLVEGEEDRAAVLAAAELMGFDFEAAGVSVIPCGGKDNLNRPLLTLRTFAVPVFVIWDVDNNPASSHNKILTSALELEGKLSPWPGSHCGDTWSCFNPDLTKTIIADLGSAYSEHMKDVKELFEFDSDEDARKRSMVMFELFKRCDEEGFRSETLCRTVESVVTLASEHGIEITPPRSTVSTAIVS
jgi:putative ATP-dependent endonuclease of the OLD family